MGMHVVRVLNSALSNDDQVSARTQFNPRLSPRKRRSMRLTASMGASAEDELPDPVPFDDIYGRGPPGVVFADPHASAISQMFIDGVVASGRGWVPAPIDVDLEPNTKGKHESEARSPSLPVWETDPRDVGSLSDTGSDDPLDLLTHVNVDELASPASDFVSNGLLASTT
jgi:hypothetical protein